MHPGKGTTVKRSPALLATLAVGGALMTGGLAGASAAPAPAEVAAAHAGAGQTTHAAATPARARAIAAKRAQIRKRAALRRAKAVHMKRLRVLNGRYMKLSRSAAECTAAAPALRITARIRMAAVKGSSVAGPRQLRQRQMRLSKAIVHLARARADCTVPRPRVAPVVPARAVPAPAAPAPSPAPASAPAAPTAPAPATPAPAPRAVQVDVPQSALLAGLPIDLSGALGTTLPDVLNLVSLEELSGGLCQSTGVLCVGLDPANLTQTLNAMIGSVPLVGPLLQPLLSPVLSLLAVPSGDLSELFRLVDLGGGVLQLVPEGLLGTLMTSVQALLGPLNAVLGDQTLPLGLLQIP